MLIDVRKLTVGRPCAIMGTGHTVLGDEHRYDNRRFIMEVLSSVGREALRQHLDPQHTLSDEMFLDECDRKFVEATGIRSRYIFPGTTAELGALAAHACLADAGVAAGELEALIVGTNTGHGYPSTADLIKRLIGAPVQAESFDLQEACAVGAVAVQLGWEKVRSGVYRRVLVVCAEKASLLASPEDYKVANLFGDAAFALLLGPAEQEQFLFFDCGSDPGNGQAEFIIRTTRGFQQKGPSVHKYVGTEIPKLLDEVFQQLELNPNAVDHFFPHQPSAKTIAFLLHMLRKRWPSFQAMVHQNVEVMGNTSGACTGWMISQARLEGMLKQEQMCLVSTFGSGMSFGHYAFIVR
ncbi:MAG: hypothetical protein HY420_03170 [Candidatus Kerfeldbacteria bacterium]|nr:hypothetical protein [Candidatus Kerfeldbacteria bacterium]